MNILRIRYLIAFMMVALLGYGSQAIAFDASARSTVTLSFSSGHDWITFNKDPGDTAYRQGKNSIGPGAALCLYNSSCGGGSRICH
jgi:hypothetical protein